MITLRRLDLIRQDSAATADELASLQTQLNALLFTQVEAHLVEASAAPLLLPVAPSGFVEFSIRGQRFVLPFFAKAQPHGE